MIPLNPSSPGQANKRVSYTPTAERRTNLWQGRRYGSPAALPFDRPWILSVTGIGPSVERRERSPLRNNNKGRLTTSRWTAAPRQPPRRALREEGPAAKGEGGRDGGWKGVSVSSCVCRGRVPEGRSSLRCGSRGKAARRHKPRRFAPRGLHGQVAGKGVARRACPGFPCTHRASHSAVAAMEVMMQVGHQSHAHRLVLFHQRRGVLPYFPKAGFGDEVGITAL